MVDKSTLVAASDGPDIAPSNSRSAPQEARRHCTDIRYVIKYQKNICRRVHCQGSGVRGGVAASALILSCHYRASPREKSKEKSQCKKVKFSCLNMKENKETGHKSTFLAPLFLLFGTFLATLGLGQKMPIFFRIRLKKLFHHFKKQNMVLQILYFCYT